ncbi:trigger factor [Candidatus Falkowbacteria bacterium]|nr:trigger factor [Candidatus Falkowbacteria bacterium]NCQ12954.1 trigger factor [Candidatus Falkowbacteria bacterium]OIO06662.1 MAG: trigger factor [Candidatus Falkowbacteria bacterium CG1_02_37_21]
MKVDKKDLPKSQIELSVELTAEELAPYITKGAEEVAKTVKIEGFRPGKAPFDVLKQKVGEMSILEAAANIAIRKTIDEVIEKNTMGRQAIGQPQVNITKLAPNNPLEYKVIVSLVPEIALGKYKDLKLKTEEAQIDDKELDKAVDELREMRATEAVVDRAIEKGDKVTVDVHLFLDKVQVEDGHHHDLAVLTGKDYFVPGFDDKLMGAKKGETREFSLPYPDDHHQKNLAGKMVDFKVEVKEVYSRTIPKLDDTLAAFFQMKDLADLKKNLQESMLNEKSRSLNLKNESEMIGKIVEDTKFGDLPENLITSETKNVLAELEQNVTRQGGKFEDYLQHLKKTKDQLMLELTPNAIKRVKSALVIREIAVLEKINPSDDEVKQKVEELKKQYVGREEILKMFDEPGYFSYLANILTNEQVIAKLKEWNYAPTGAQQKS